MDTGRLQEHLDQRLDRIEGKLDNHLERLSKAETSVEWLRGHARTVTTLILTALSGFAIVAYEYLSK